MKLFFSERLPNSLSFNPPFPYSPVVSDLILAFARGLDIRWPLSDETSPVPFLLYLHYKHLPPNALPKTIAHRFDKYRSPLHGVSSASRRG